MNILFGAKGRISANQFWQGIILLVGLQILIYLGMGYISPFFSLAYFLLIYPYVCVYSKRLHDSGKSGWLFLAFVAAWLVLGTVMGALTASFSAVDQVAIQAEAEVLAESGDLGALFALYQETAKADLVLSIINMIILNVVVGFIVARMSSDPHSNQYGDPAGGYVAPEAEDDIFS